MGKRGEEFLGHAVANGQVRFWSVSSLEKGDPRSDGCPRRWAYRYVFGRKEPQSDYAAAGERLHDELKRYETGELRREQLSAEAVAGLHIVPEPGPDLLAEAPLHRSREVVPGAPWLIEWAPLTAAGIPVIGFMDLQHARGTNKGTEDVASAYDPPGTVEVIDWKRKGSAKAVDYMLEPAALLQTIQMSGYGVHVTRAWGGVQHIRLSHGYFVCPSGKTPRARKVSLRVLPEQALRAWEYAEGIARTLIDVAKERDVHRVPANLEACDRFGGCPHREYCRASRVESLSGVLGESGAQSLIKELEMGLVSNALGGAPLPSAPMAQPPAPQQYAPPQPMQAAPQPQASYTAPQPIAPPPAMQPQVAAAVDMRAQLEAEERQLAAQAAATTQVTPEFSQAVKVIETSGRGFPMLQGRAAQMRAALGGMMLPPGAALSGGGEFGQRLQPIEDPAIVVQLARDLNPQMMGAAQPPMQQVAVAPAPQPAPSPAPQPAPQYAQPQPAPQQAPYAFGGTLPPDAPTSNPNTAIVQPSSEPAKRRTRKPKSEAAPMPEQQPAAPPVASPATGTVAGQVAPSVGAAEEYRNAVEGVLEVFVDCLPLGDYRSLRGYVDYICSALAQRYCVGQDGKPGLQDIRIAPKDSPLGFGGWKGVLAATVRELPPQPGTYVLDTRGSEIAEVVADALASVCEARGALYARGIK